MTRTYAKNSPAGHPRTMSNRAVQTGVLVIMLLLAGPTLVSTAQLDQVDQAVDDADRLICRQGLQETNDVCLSDLEAWVARYTGPPGSPESSFESAGAVVVSHDGSTLYVAGIANNNRDTTNTQDYAVVAYDAETGAQLWEARYAAAAGAVTTSSPAGWDTALALSFDGSKVILAGGGQETFGSGVDAVTVAFDAQTGNQLWRAVFAGPPEGLHVIQTIVAAPNDPVVYVAGHSAGSHLVIAYDDETGDELWVARPTVDTSYVDAIDVSADGSQVFISGRSKAPGGSGNWYFVTIALDAQTGEEVWRHQFNGPANRTDHARDVKVSPDGSTVFATGYATFGVGVNGPPGRDYFTIAYDAHDGSVLWMARHDGGAGSIDVGQGLAVNPDGSAVYVIGMARSEEGSQVYDTVAYDAETGAELWLARYDSPANDLGLIAPDWGLRIDISPDGTKVFVGGFSTGLSTSPGFGIAYATIAYDSETGEEVWAARYNGPEDSNQAYALAVDPTGQRVFVTGMSWGGEETGMDFATVAYVVDAEVSFVENLLP